MQVRAQELEEKEREQYMVDVHKKILASEANLMTKQGNEMSALKKKLEAKMNERLKMREVEHNKILQRYQNVKKEIENQQNIERIKRERAYKVVARPQSASQRSTMGASKMTQSKMGQSKSGNPAGPSSSNRRWARLPLEGKDRIRWDLESLNESEKADKKTIRLKDSTRSLRRSKVNLLKVIKN